MAGLATISDLVHHLRLDPRDFLVDAFEIWNNDPVATRASVAVGRRAIVLTKVGGACEGALTFRFATYPTLAALCAAIEGYAGATTTTTTSALLCHLWYVNLLAHPLSRTTDLQFMPIEDALGYENRVPVQITDMLWAEYLLDHTEDFMERYCRRAFASTVYVDEAYNGSGTALLVLRNYPITTVTEIKEDDCVVDSSLYEVDSAAGLVWRKGGVWSVGAQNIEVSHTAGYTAVPAELRSLCLEISAVFFHKGGRDPLLKSVKMSTYSKTLFEAFLGPGLIERLALWARMEPYG